MRVFFRYLIAYIIAVIAVYLAREIFNLEQTPYSLFVTPLFITSLVAVVIVAIYTRMKKKEK